MTNYDDAVKYMCNNPQFPYPVCTCGAEAVLRNGRFGPFFCCPENGILGHKGDTCSFFDWQEHAGETVTPMRELYKPPTTDRQSSPAPAPKRSNAQKEKIKKLKEDVVKLSSGDATATRNAVLKVLYDVLNILEEIL